MTYAIIGTGAIGGYYGAQLQRAGHDVHFLLHRDYEYVRANGLQVNSCDGDFHLDHVQAYDTTERMPKADVVLVGLKSVNNNLLKTLLPPLLREDTLVVLIQNGIGLEADVQAMFPQTAVAAGLAFICCGKTKPGVVDHQCYGSINIGNFSDGDGRRLDQLLAELRGAGVEAHLVDYAEARWKKAVWNMPFNGLTVVLDTTTDRLLAHPATEQLVRDIMTEVTQAAKACGAEHVDAAFVEQMIETTRRMTPYSPSMKLDFDHHRPMEIGYLYTRAIAEARKAGCDMPKCRMLEQQLLFLSAEQARRG